MPAGSAENPKASVPLPLLPSLSLQPLVDFNLVAEPSSPPTALIKAAAARAFQDGYTRMSISIVRGNDHAGDLYRKLGARHLHYFTDHFEEAESRSEELLWDDIRVLLDD